MTALAHTRAWSSGAAPRQLIGREAALDALGQMLARHRLISIVGPGGVGKTSLARALAQPGRWVVVLDLAAMPDARHLLPALAQALGLPDGATGRERDLGLRFGALLAGREVLVVLDGCEHMIDACASGAELLLGAAPGVTVLATSREALRADGERVYRLAPMLLPAPDTRDPAGALASPAVRLFALRAFGGRPLAPGEVSAVVALCRALDGLPLALELAAAMAPRLGLETLAGWIGQRLLVTGQRQRALRPGRHLSLSAMLAWSYDLLAPEEQAVFRRLSVFRGGFTLDAAAAVAGAAGMEPDQVKEIVIGLVGKSLVSPANESGGRHRLLDTTRAYAARLHEADRDRGRVRACHAGWLCTLLEQALDAWLALERDAWLARYSPWLDDVRAALDWAFAPGGDEVAGVRLTASGFPLADQAGAGLEFGARVGEALAVLGRMGDVDEALPLARLRLAGFSWNAGSEGGGQVSAVLRAHANVLRSSSGTPAQMESGPLFARWCFAFGSADYPGALATVRALDSAAREQDDPVLAQLARKALAQSLHFMGRHQESMAIARAALSGMRRIPLGYVASPVPIPVTMRIVLARILWLRADPVGAAAMCREAMQHALEDSPIGQCHVIGVAALPIALWNRDLEAGAALLAQLEEHAQRYSFGLWQRWTAHYRALLGCLDGDREAAQACAAQVAARDAKQSDHLATFDVALLAPGALARVEAGQVGWCAPETLRARAEQLLAQGRGDAAGPDSPRLLLLRSLALAREQGALAWELRSACSLARLGDGAAALDTLRAVLARCPQGDNADRRSARRLLEG